MTINSKRDNHSYLRFLSFVLLSAWVFWAAYGLYLDYSFWHDELYSIATSKNIFPERLRTYLVDVHPPLYHELLSLWVILFSDSEFSARFLSVIFVSLSFLSFAVIKRKFGVALAFLTFDCFLANSLVYYYAQEARPYGLLLLLSAFVTFFFISGDRRAIFVFLVPLGFTHFYGAMLAGLVCLYMLFDWTTSRSEKMYSLIGICSCLIWPTVYIWAGSGAEVIGGNFWITTSSMGTVMNGFSAASPIVMSLINKLTPLGSAFLFGLIIAVFLKSYKASSKDSRIAMNQALYILIGTTVIAALIGLHTPTSTIRNHIIVVPAASFLIGITAWEMLKVGPRWLMVILILAYVTVGQVQIMQSLRDKLTPHQDWRLTSQLAESEVAADRLFVWGGRDDRLPFNFNLIRKAHYLTDGHHAELVSMDGIFKLNSGDVLLFGHVPPNTKWSEPCGNKITDALSYIGKDYVAHFTTQGWTCQNGYIVIQ